MKSKAQKIANKAVRKAGGRKVRLRKNTFSAKRAVKRLGK